MSTKEKVNQTLSSLGELTKRLGQIGPDAKLGDEKDGEPVLASPRAGKVAPSPVDGVIVVWGPMQVGDEPGIEAGFHRITSNGDTFLAHEISTKVDTTGTRSWERVVLTLPGPAQAWFAGLIHVEKKLEVVGAVLRTIARGDLTADDARGTSRAALIRVGLPEQGLFVPPPPNAPPPKAAPAAPPAPTPAESPRPAVVARAAGSVTATEIQPTYDTVVVVLDGSVVVSVGDELHGSEGVWSIEKVAPKDVGLDVLARRAAGHRSPTTAPSTAFKLKRKTAIFEVPAEPSQEQIAAVSESIQRAYNDVEPFEIRAQLTREKFAELFGEGIMRRAHSPLCKSFQTLPSP